MYYIGGSFAKYLRGKVAKYKDIDIYVSHKNLIPLLNKLSKKGIGLVGHQDDKIVSHSAKLGNIDIMVFHPNFKFSTTKIGCFRVLSNRTLKRIYKYANNK